jgi:hypothetical protein
MIEYYARRALEYEQVYAKPERQADLGALRAECRTLFAGRDLLEISCGTAWWTECLVSAKRIVATDINPEVLDIARAKTWDHCPVEFLIADSMALPDSLRDFDAGFAGFWWSHVPVEKLHAFLTGFHSHLTPGALVAFIDNRYVEGSSTPPSRRDAAGNTWQIRRLADGSCHEVMKNFPTADQIREALRPFADVVELRIRDYFWMAIYHTHRR